MSKRLGFFMPNMHMVKSLVSVIEVHHKAESIMITPCVLNIL